MDFYCISFWIFTLKSHTHSRDARSSVAQISLRSTRARVCVSVCVVLWKWRRDSLLIDRNKFRVTNIFIWMVFTLFAFVRTGRQLEQFIFKWCVNNMAHSRRRHRCRYHQPILPFSVNNSNNSWSTPATSKHTHTALQDGATWIINLPVTAQRQHFRIRICVCLVIFFLSPDDNLLSKRCFRFFFSFHFNRFSTLYDAAAATAALYGYRTSHMSRWYVAQIKQAANGVTWVRE